MDNIDQDLEFLNYEGVCTAEREILQTILCGGDSKEYSKGLFSFDTPFNVEGQTDSICIDVDVDVGQIDNLTSAESVGDISVTSQATSNPDVAEVSISIHSQNFNNESTLPLTPSIPHHGAIVSQTGHPLQIPQFYPAQHHMTVSVSASPGTISSVGPNSASNNPPSGPGNPMVMFSHAMQQMIPSPTGYYSPHPAYYGPPQGGGQPHMSFVPVGDGVNPDASYMTGHPQGQVHHKIHHESHHSVPHSPNSSGQNQGGSAYSKSRRTKPQQQQQHYYYPNPSYYGQIPYFNQQQLQNVTGSPIIMAGGASMYLPPQHHPGVYAQGPTGNEMDRLPPQAIIQMQNDMSYSQQHHTPSHSQLYPHSSPNHSSRISYNPQPSNRGTGALPQSDSNVLTELKSDVSSTEISSPKLSGSQISSDIEFVEVRSENFNNSSCKSVSSSSNEKNADIDSISLENKSHNTPPLKNENILDSLPPSILNGEESSNMDTVVHQQSSTSKDEFENSETKIIPAVTKMKQLSEDSTTDMKAKPKTNSINGDTDTTNEIDIGTSIVRDNVSAACVSDSTVDQESNTNSKSSDINIKTVTVSVNNNNSSRSSFPNLKNVKDSVKINDNITGVTNVKGPTAPNPKSTCGTGPAQSRSWASIASIKSRNNDGASARHTLTNHDHPDDEDHSLNSITRSNASHSGHSQNNVPISEDKAFAHDFHLDTSFDAAPLSDENDPIAIRLGEHLLKYTLDHQSIPLAPRGLCNQSNYCFLNATLQALLSCPTFVNMFRAMSPVIGRTPCKATPIIQSVFDFVLEFSPLLRSHSTKKDRMREGFCVGPNLEPVGIRKCLALLSKDTFKIEGRQEDAEEFLSHLLNGLHDEMIKVIKWAENKKDRIEKGPEQPVPSAVNGDQEDSKDEDDDQWQVMGAKNKSCLTRRAAITKSPISEAFLGQMCLSLNRINSTKKADLEPFFTLQLAIQNDNVKSVKDALEAVSIKEEVSGITSSSGSEVEAWRQVSLEELPPVLILHLKRFVYEKNGILKINKKLDFGVDLEIGKDLLSNNTKSKLIPKQRQYKLFAVVYHDGEEAHKGHYVADCFHTSGGTMWGQWGWLRYDDTAVKPVNEANMLNPQPPRVPYLLYYRRQDTIQQQIKKERS